MASELLQMQTPSGVPLSPLVEAVADPMLPPQRSADMLAHFFDRLYDLRPESHLSRLLKVVLGDPGAGQLRKKYVYAQLSQVLLTAHFYDLDRLFADIFGLKRFMRETLDIDPYNDSATAEEWEAIRAADAAYRARVEQFARAIPWGGSPTGMVLAANAILGYPVRVYETYTFLNDQETYALEQETVRNTYSDLEEMGYYRDLEGRTYAQLEGSSRYQGRLVNTRGEFIVRPLRTVTEEEKYHLIRVLGRLKPAGALMTLDSRGAAESLPVPVFQAYADSTYWHIRTKVAVTDPTAETYLRYDPAGYPVEQPRPAFSHYQGEAWSYNSDVVSVTSYTEDAEGEMVLDTNYERRMDPATGEITNYTPDLSLADPTSILLGRYASDGVLSVSPASRSGEREVAA